MLQRNKNFIRKYNIQEQKEDQCVDKKNLISGFQKISSKNLDFLDIKPLESLIDSQSKF